MVIISHLLSVIPLVKSFPASTAAINVRSNVTECRIVHDAFLMMGGDTQSVNPFGAPSETRCCSEFDARKYFGTYHGITCDSNGHVIGIDWVCGECCFKSRKR